VSKRFRKNTTYRPFPEIAATRPFESATAPFGPSARLASTVSCAAATAAAGTAAATSSTTTHTKRPTTDARSHTPRRSDTPQTDWAVRQRSAYAMVDFPRFRGHLMAVPTGRPERMSVDANYASVFAGVPA
jgi:hypothetical protein